MKIPPLTIGAALLLWGLESGKIGFALLLCLVLEGSHFIPRRYSLDEDDFVKISDLTSLLFLGAVALILLNYEPLGFLRITTGWMPLILSPLIVAQLFSTGNTVTIGTRLGTKKKAYTHRPIDFRLYYIIICLFAAAAANSRGPWFYPATTAIVAVVLFANRGRAYSPVVFALLLLVSSTAGYLGSMVIVTGHGYVVQNTFRYFYRYYRNTQASPFKAHVNFGDTGRLKFSGEILMRVSSAAPPSLLKEASYSLFQRGDWFSPQGKYEFLLPADRVSWILRPEPMEEGETVKIELGLPKEKGLLPLPLHGYALRSATVFELERHENGTLKAVDAAPIATYEVDYDSGPGRADDLPTMGHLDVPEEEKYVLDRIASELGGENLSASARLDALGDFFAADFQYSLDLVGSGDFATPLGNFLLESKSGFCEYYATAATLLLRTMKIPSRYVTGYAVYERSVLEGKYLVRSRHAHAWSEAFVDGGWVTVDTTPPVWKAADEARADSLEGLRDVFSFLGHKYRLFRIGTGRDYTFSLSVVVAVLTIFLVLRIYRRLKLEKAEIDDTLQTPRIFTRIVTPFTPVVDALAASETSRHEYESFGEWAARCHHWQNFDTEEFSLLYGLHLQQRFDPVPGNEHHLQRLQQGAVKYLPQLQDEKQR